MMLRGAGGGGRGALIPSLYNPKSLSIFSGKLGIGDLVSLKDRLKSIQRRALAVIHDYQDEDVPQTYKTDLPHGNSAVMNLSESRSMNKDNVFNKEQGI